MQNLKRYVVCLQIFLVFFSTSSQAQTRTLDCTLDSVLYESLLTYFDTIKTSDIRYNTVNELILKHQNQNDGFCNLVLYSTIFDELLLRGLDLDYNYILSPPMINSTNLPEDHENIKKMKRDRIQYYLYRFYVSLKSDYEQRVTDTYAKNKNRSLEKDVLNVIKYGGHCTRPTTLKAMLLSKNATALREKLDKEMKIFFGDD